VKLHITISKIEKELLRGKRDLLTAFFHPPIKSNIFPSLPPQA